MYNPISKQYGFWLLILSLPGALTAPLDHRDSSPNPAAIPPVVGPTGTDIELASTEDFWSGEFPCHEETDGLTGTISRGAEYVSHPANDYEKETYNLSDKVDYRGQFAMQPAIDSGFYDDENEDSTTPDPEGEPYTKPPPQEEEVAIPLPPPPSESTLPHKIQKRSAGEETETTTPKTAQTPTAINTTVENHKAKMSSTTATPNNTAETNTPPSPTDDSPATNPTSNIEPPRLISDRGFKKSQSLLAVSWHMECDDFETAERKHLAGLSSVDVYTENFWVLVRERGKTVSKGIFYDRRNMCYQLCACVIMIQEPPSKIPKFTCHPPISEVQGRSRQEMKMRNDAADFCLGLFDCKCMARMTLRKSPRKGTKLERPLRRLKEEKAADKALGAGGNRAGFGRQDGLPRDGGPWEGDWTKKHSAYPYERPGELQYLAPGAKEPYYLSGPDNSPQPWSGGFSPNFGSLGSVMSKRSETGGDNAQSA
ncbi:hypothetical protein TWF481_011068 [Arthrobotrys musiformis]|uniref:Uncharacterized protein n=1 Tax=Arthrobotrys musiformis TaxID=47236 RepID=A0AAV9VYB5_9PEZI